MAERKPTLESLKACKMRFWLSERSGDGSKCGDDDITIMHIIITMIIINITMNIINIIMIIVHHAHKHHHCYITIITITMHHQ